MPELKHGLLKFVFDYPYHIGVPDGEYVIRLRDGSPGVVRIFGKEGIQSYDKSLNQRPCPEGSEEPELIEVEGNSKNAQIIVTTNNDAAVYTVAGEKGKVTYPWYFSSVEVIFSVNNIYGSIATPSNQEEAYRFMREFFNKFLYSYRHASADVFTRILNKESDILLYILLYVNEFSDQEQADGSLSDVLINLEKLNSREFKPYPMQGPSTSPEIIPLVSGRYSSYTSTDLKKPILSVEKIPLLKGNCVSLDEMPAYRKMLLSGLEKIALDDDYNSAIINFDTVVEMTAASIISEALKRGGKTEQEIEDLFDESIPASYQLRDQGYLTTMKRMTRLEEFINESNTQKSLSTLVMKDAQEFKDWNEKVRRKRNKIVHAGKFYGEVEAREAFTAAQKFMIFLENEEKKMTT